ncbi:MAG: YitT family protein [Chlamydiae bacterium]|nr:YitT family protein [Chlamydiota bacterium]
MPNSQTIKTWLHHSIIFFWLALGAGLAALSIKVFLFPHQLIDGGIVGIALILTRIWGADYLSYFLVLLNLPFIYLALKFIRRTFVAHMLLAVLLFAGFLFLFNTIPPFDGDSLEIIVFGGAILGIGVGLIIRYGGCLDGTEILGIIINRKKGFTVGQVVLVINIFIFAAYGWIFEDWHIALKSLMTYIVAVKMIDMVIVGLDELKSVLIISSRPKELAEAITQELGLGLTIMHGKGGFSGDAREILFVIVERLDLSDLKELILKKDPTAFMAIENLHEVVYGKQPTASNKRKGRKLFKAVSH